MSKLQLGLIPARTECPFADKCGFKLCGSCKHLGVNHTVDYSCAMARFFDIMEPKKPCTCREILGLPHAAPCERHG